MCARVSSAHSIQVLFYLFTVHADVWKVLRHYSDVVEVIPWALPGHLPNDPERRSQFLHSETWQRRRLEVLPYNHCLYENLNRFQFIIPIDIDEVILPIKQKDWMTLMERVLYKQHRLLDTVASFAVQNTYFFHRWDLISHNDTYQSLLQMNFRTGNFSHLGHGVKSFINTKVAKTVFNHYALGVLHPGQTFVVNLDRSLVQLNHYKEDCLSTKLSREECQSVFLPSKVADDRFRQRFGFQLQKKVEQELVSLLHSHPSP